VVVDKLPLDSPLWSQLSACYSREDALAAVREIVTTTRLGSAWKSLCDEVLHQGTVYGVSSAVIPHLIDVAPRLSVADKRELWIEVGFLVSAGADRFPSPPAPGLQDGLTAALGVGNTRAVQDFLADAELTPDESSYYALACLTLAGHRVGRTMWDFPSPASGYVRVSCPRCGNDYEVDGFADPFAPPSPAPVFQAIPDQVGAWRETAAAIDRVDREDVLGTGWSAHLEVARQVALAGVPESAPSDAVWCLVAAMVATRSPVGAAWARTLARLAGHGRCPDCDVVWPIADVIGDNLDAEPVDAASLADGLPHGFVQDALFTVDVPARREIPPATVAEPVSGFRPAPGRAMSVADVQAQRLWRADIGPVDGLTLVAGRPTVVAAATGTAVLICDMATGRVVGAPLAGPAHAVASMPLSVDRAAVVAAGDDGTLRFYDVGTGQLLGRPMAADRAPVPSLAPVDMPPGRALVDWLDRLRTGRVLLAAGDADGAVRLWDPAAGKPVHEVFRRAGRPVVSLTEVALGDKPPWRGTDLVALYNDHTVDVWGSGAVHGNLSGMAPDPRKLVAVGHQHLVGSAVSPASLGYRRPVLLVDRDGTVSTWETFGVRLWEPLPSDPAHRDVVGIVALPDGDDDITVVTASRADRNLRVWKPIRDSVALVPLDVTPRCLLNDAGTVLVGHENGLLALSLANRTQPTQHRARQFDSPADLQK
jgi:hypothetical protein